ncbi:MAG: hypothetical protein WDA16_02940 [Candidatus Thermoplasmatota archaeon]
MTPVRAAYSAALVCFGLAVILVGTYLAMARATGELFSLTFFVLALLVIVVAIAFWALALLLAASGRGTIPKPAIVAGSFAAMVVAVMSLLSLRDTGEPAFVIASFIVSFVALCAGVLAWRRKPASG